MRAGILPSFHFASLLELDKNKIVPLSNNISKVYLFAVFRLAMRLPPYLLFADLSDASPDQQSIRRVVHFINSHLVSTSNLINALLHVYFSTRRVTFLDKSGKWKAPSSLLTYLREIEGTLLVGYLLDVLGDFKVLSSLCFRGLT